MKKLPKTLSEPLARALSVKRSAGSIEEAQFRAWLVKRYAELLDMVDEAGNLHFVVGQSTTLFAAHCDTAHHGVGPNKYTVSKGTVKAADECLGADDGAGVAILCHMLSNRIPGRYIFTTAEEVEGIGARYIADNFPNLLGSYSRAICFDRAGTEEIVTVQGGQRCASSEFAEALSVAFQDEGMLYAESVNGVYTDCKEWADLVVECCNLSVGYAKQHGPNETLDLEHLRTLAAAVLNIAWENLPTVRDPSESRFNLWGRSTKGEAHLGLGISEKRINQLYTKELTVDDYGDVVHLAIDGDDSLLTDLVCSHFGLSMRDAWVLDFSSIKMSEYVTAANMRPEAGLKWLYAAATTEIPH